MSEVRFIAIGDSFTEGVGDEPDGENPRGWADLAAQGWADSIRDTVQYANLAIRGKLVWPIVDEQLERALALGPTHLSFNGGGNDMLRPRTPLTRVSDAFAQVAKRCQEEGVRFILLSGGNPSAQLPLGRVVQRRGDALAIIVAERLREYDEIIQALNWPDRELSRPEYWSPDRLHMNARGHHRVAARVLDALGLTPRAQWWSLPLEAQRVLRQSEYNREYLRPWLKRRLTGTSSGDGRMAKQPEWVTLHPNPTS